MFVCLKTHSFHICQYLCSFGQFFLVRICVESSIQIYYLDKNWCDESSGVTLCIVDIRTEYTSLSTITLSCTSIIIYIPGRGTGGGGDLRGGGPERTSPGGAVKPPKR